MREWDDRVTASKRLTSDFRSTVDALASEWAEVNSHINYIEGKQAVLEVRGAHCLLGLGTTDSHTILACLLSSASPTRHNGSLRS